MLKTISIVAMGAGLAAAIYVLKNLPAPQHATGSGDIEDAARNTSAWGSKQRLGGKGRGLVGSLKEGIGRATGNKSLQDEGAVDHIGGAVQDAAGQLAQAAGQTLHDFNR